MSKDIYIYYKTGPVLIAHNRITYDTPNGISLSATSKQSKAIIILEETNYGYF